MDARTQPVSVAADLDAPAQGDGAPFEWLEFRSIDATYGMWVNVQGGEAGVGAPGAVYFAPREPCRLRYRSPRANGKWRLAAESGTVTVNVIAYTADEVGEDRD